MRKLSILAMVIVGSSAIVLDRAALADNAPAPVATITITRATSACTAPGAGPSILGYPCSYPLGTRDITLVKNKEGNALLTDGRTFQLVLKDVFENPRRYRVIAASKKSGGDSFLALADITAKVNEPFNFRFPYQGSEAMFLEIAIH